MKIMAFVSVTAMAEKKSSRRSSSQQLSSIAITQSYLEHRENSTLTIRLSPKCLAASRLQKGDMVDVLFDEESALWKICLASKGIKGYKISGTETSVVGVIRFTLYQGMPTIADIKSRKVRSFCDESSLQYGAGEVIFKMKDVELLEDDE